MKLLYCDTVGPIGSFGLLLVRIALGLVFFYHGGEKIKHAKTWMDDMPAAVAVAPPPARPLTPEERQAAEKAAEAKAAADAAPKIKVPGELQMVAAYTEYIGGAALIVGLLTRIFALGLSAMMAGAIYLVHMANPLEPFVAATSSSYERAIVYGACALMFFIVGPGRLSIDAILFGGSPKHPQPPYPPPPQRM